MNLWYHGLMARRCFPVAKIGSSSLPGIVGRCEIWLFLLLLLRYLSLTVAYNLVENGVIDNLLL